MTQTKWYRTSKGTRRHSDWACANARRAILLGGLIEIPADEIKDWAACSVCSDGVAIPTTPAVDRPAQCKNSGVTNPRRLYSNCKDCGKEGAVMRKTGSLRAHPPAN